MKSTIKILLFLALIYTCYQTNTTTNCNNIPNCVQCYVNQTYCVTCANTYLPNNGGCVLCNIAGCGLCQNPNNCTSCMNGYQLNTVNGLCISCNIAGCSSCSNNNICGQCNTGLIPSASGNKCVSCNIANCSSCSDNNVCSICNNGYQLTQATSTSNAQCVMCSVQNCASCMSNNYCQMCVSGYNAVNGTCLICSYPCQTCNPNGSCATCVTPFFAMYPASNGSCFASTVPNCMSYSSTNTSVCSQCTSAFTLNATTNACQLICNAVCASCNASIPNTCLSCNSGYYLANNTCNQCQSTGCNSCNSTTCLACTSGFYLISGECKPCPGYCAVCSSATVCTQLIQSSSQVLVQQGSQTLLAICPQTCISCSNLNPSICLGCFAGFYLNNGVCQACGQSCMTCSSTNPNTCLSCYPNNFLTNGNCVSCTNNCQTCSQTNTGSCLSCYPGSYLNNNQCIQGCPANCVTCSASGVCTQCNSGYTLFQQNSSQTICVQCTTNCRSCAQGQPAACLSCGSGFYLSGTSCLTCTSNCQTCTSDGCVNCIAGFFLTSSLTCSPNCQVPCATCSSNDPTKCSSCIAGYSYNSLSFSCTPAITCGGACSTCPIGYSLQTGQCNKCNTANCQVCSSTNLNICTSCAPGYYLNSNSQCLSCPSSCATCLQGNGCLTCAAGYTSLSLLLPQAKGLQCIACTYPCATCQYTPNYCTSCASGYQFTGWKCTQTFYFGFTLTLLTTSSTFNSNYFNFLSYLTNAIGASNPNIISINGITFGSVNVQGQVAPTANSGSLQSNLQYGDLESALSQNSNIAGMQVGSSSITVNGGTIDYDKVNLGLILGICIPVGVLIIAGIVFYVYRRKRRALTIEQKIYGDGKEAQRESFELSGSYKEADASDRPL